MINPSKRPNYVVDQLQRHIEQAKRLIQEEKEEEISLCFYCSFGEVNLTKHKWRSVRAKNFFTMIVTDSQGPLRALAALYDRGVLSPAFIEALSTVTERIEEMREEYTSGKEPKDIDTDHAADLVLETLTAVLTDS